MLVPGDGSFELFGLDTIDFGQIAIQDHSHTTYGVNSVLNVDRVV